MTEHSANNRTLVEIEGGRRSTKGELEAKLIRLLRQLGEEEASDYADEDTAEPVAGGQRAHSAPVRAPGDALAQAALARPERAPERRPAPANTAGGIPDGMPAVSRPAPAAADPAGPAPEVTFARARQAPAPAAPIPEPQPQPQPQEPAVAAMPETLYVPPPYRAPQTVAVDAHAKAAQAGPAPAALPEAQPARVPMPADFGFEDEHPQIHVPFTLQIGNRRFDGKSLSVTHLVLAGDGQEPLDPHTREVARLQVHFNGFDLTLHPEVALRETARNGDIVLFFTDPTGPHLPQLRYVLNNTISGDVTTLNGLLAYTGPTAPKPAKPADAPATMKQRARSLSILAVTALLILAGMAALYARYTTGKEMYPVFVERGGQPMRATAAGQITYLNPEAMEGDVIFSLNANSGDVLNFVLPCDCEVAISADIQQGTTVLPSDLILTIFENSSVIRAHTMISVEGLARAMEGDKVILDLNDGRSIPVEVVISQATSAATMGGGLFVPVQLRAPEGALTAEDAGRNGRLRITSNVFSRVGMN